jgi:putative DNA primase/helicase
MDGQAALITFLQRAVGYALTGDTSEHVLFLLHGTGRNGKSTFLETLHALLGDYAKQADFATFLARKHDTVRNDLAELQGARFVAAVEVEEGRRLAENLVKQLTGGDRIKARFLYQEYFEYVPQFKVFLACNHKPVIRGTDLAIWERIRLIPFTVTIPKAERDTHLLTKLLQELPGILAWAVQGCLAWQQHGLGEPQAVVQATGAYRAEMDLLGSFLEDTVVLGTHHQVTSKDLYTAYCTWCETNGETPMSKKALGSRLLERGCAPVRLGPKQARGWQGLGLVTPHGPLPGEGLAPLEPPSPVAVGPPGADPPPPLDTTLGATDARTIAGAGPPAAVPPVPTAPPDTTAPPALPALRDPMPTDDPGPPDSDQAYEELLL